MGAPLNCSASGSQRSLLAGVAALFETRWADFRAALEKFAHLSPECMGHPSEPVEACQPPRIHL